MKLKFLLTILILSPSCSLSLFAQTPYSIKGSVVDASLNIKLINTAIMVLNSKDSTLAKFAWSKTDGSFNVNSLKAGKFILLISYHDYADYVEHFTLSAANPERDFGQVKLALKSRLLQEVVIKGAAIIIKGDTTEYNASSYKVQPNARVEDLLKQLPGIQVDQNGRITAQGKPVNKVLLDGEEFFSDDPTLVTRNIRADMVNKVQLFDKKSDQAVLIGINDGEKNKTINITLKEDKKNGYFGKADGGGATDEYYQGQIMFNVFKATQKFSAYGTIGNTNRTGLAAQDNSKYGITPSAQGDQLDSFTGVYSGEGLPSTKTGGVHYDTKWNTNKESLNMNYRISSIGVEGTKNTLIQNNLPTGAINTNMNQNNDNKNFRQRLDASYQVTLNPSSTLKITADGGLSNSQTNIGYLTTGSRANNVLLNTQNRSVNNDADYKSFNASALWAKKFKKMGRTTSLLLSQAFNNTDTKGYLYSQNSFYNSAGILDSTKIVDQYKPTSAQASIFNSNLTYSEPISKSFSMVLNYGLRLNSNSSDNRSYNLSAPGKYTLLDNIYSSNFERELLSNQAGAIFNYNKGANIFNFGTKVSHVSDKQTDLNTGKEFNRTYLNWAPQLIYQNRTFLLAYSGTTMQPTIEQVQPVRINTDPLNIQIGNTGLKPSYTNTFQYEHQIINGLGGINYFLSNSYSFNNNAIVSDVSTDVAGKNTIQYVNLKNKTPSSLSISVETSKEFKSSLRTGISLNADGGNFYNLSNNVLNKTRFWNYSARMFLNKTVVKKYDFHFSITPAYIFTRSSLLSQADNSGWSVRSEGTFNIYLPGKMQIGSTANYLFQEKTQAFNKNFNRLLLNTTLTKKFFKKEDLSLNLTVNDLLNQNTGFNRPTSGSQSAGNIFTQTQYTTIKRYLMLSLVWDFTKMGPSSKK